MNITQGSLPNKANYKKGRSAAIKYIAMHFTANKGDKAVNNVKYFANNTTGTSAHFFVDEDYVYTSVPVLDTAYHCGGGLQGSKCHTYYKICTNANSIGVEMCLWDKQGNIRKGTISKAAELTRHLMKEYNIPIANVIRHWDVTGKNCPGPMVGDNNALWNEFIQMLQEDIDMEEIKKLKEVLSLVGKDIQDILKKIEAVEKENNRQNEIINLVGHDIQEIKERIGI